MKKNIVFFVTFALVIWMAACVSADKSTKEITDTKSEESTTYTPPVVTEKTTVPQVIALDEPVGGASVNDLADTIGPVTVVVDKDTSYTSSDPIQGGSMRMVEYLGKKALEVTGNNHNEIRIAFVLDKPASLAGYSTLSFSVAGFEGWDGIYNCGLLYTDAKSSGERIGSFYVSRISAKEWVSVEADLVKNEVWGKNFSGDKVLYCIQFWTNQAKKIYITDLSIK